MATAVAGLGSWLVQSSVALTLSAAAAALWCACVPNSRASVRHAVWFAALVTAVVACAIAHVRTTLLGTALDAHGAAATLPVITTPLIGGWILGAVVLLGRIAGQHLAIRRWADGLIPAGRVRSDELDVRTTQARRSRTLLLLRGEPGAMPVCWGILRPRIMLPADAVGWPDEMRDIVLRHELAHVHRRDALSDVVVRIAVALLWFHPAAWLVAARIHVERERACDERVVGSGVDVVRYAEHLIVLARSLRPAPYAAAVARQGTLEERVASLLAADGHQHALGHRLAVVLAVVAVVAPAVLLTPAVRRPIVGTDSLAEAPASTQLPGSHPGSFRATLVGGTR